MPAARSLPDCQGVDERVVVDDGAARGVDEDRPVGQQSESPGIHQPARGRRDVAVQA